MCKMIGHSLLVKLSLVLSLVSINTASLAMLQGLRWKNEHGWNGYQQSVKKNTLQSLGKLKLHPLPNLSHNELVCIAEHGDNDMKQNMWATCKTMKEKLDPYFKERAGEINLAQDYIQKVNQFPGDVSAQELEEIGNHRGSDFGKYYVLLHDDVKTFARLAFFQKETATQDDNKWSGIDYDKFNNPFDQQRYIKKCMYYSYTNLTANCIRYRAIECFKWMVQNPFFPEVKNYWRKLAWDTPAYDYHGIKENIHGPVLYDLQEYCLKHATTIAFFKDNYLEAFCKNNGFKSRQEINDEGQAAIDRVLAGSDIMPLIIKYCNPSRCEKLRLVNSFLGKLIEIPQLEKIKPFLKGERVFKDIPKANDQNFMKIIKHNENCWNAFRIAILGGDAEVLSVMMDKNMGVLKDKREQYGTYTNLVIYAIEKNRKSFKLLIKQNPDLNNYYRLSGVTYNGADDPHAVGPIIDDIEKRSYLLENRTESAIAFCKENGCLTRQEVCIYNPQDLRVLVGTLLSMGLNKIIKR